MLPCSTTEGYRGSMSTERIFSVNGSPQSQFHAVPSASQVCRSTHVIQHVDGHAHTLSDALVAAVHRGIAAAGASYP